MPDENAAGLTAMHQFRDHKVWWGAVPDENAAGSTAMHLFLSQRWASVAVNKAVKESGLAPRRAA